MNVKIKTMRKLFSKKTDDVFKMLRSRLAEYGYNPISNTTEVPVYRITPLYGTNSKNKQQQTKPQTKKETAYIYAEGTVPVMVIAHADIVHDRDPRDIILYDSAYRMFWSPAGLGADDRAGIIAILELLERGYRPHVLITNGEESGAWGASQAGMDLHDKVKDIKYLVEIDRKGYMEAVFYSNDNKEFKDYIKQQGFKITTGSFSDISVLMPEWGIAGVNLSAGYYNQHTTAEFLDLDELEDTISTVEKMLKETTNDSKSYEFVEKVITNRFAIANRTAFDTGTTSSVYDLNDYSSIYDNDSFGGLGKSEHSADIYSEFSEVNSALTGEHLPSDWLEDYSGQDTIEVLSLCTEIGNGVYGAWGEPNSLLSTYDLMTMYGADEMPSLIVIYIGDEEEPDSELDPTDYMLGELVNTINDTGVMYGVYDFEHAEGNIFTDILLSSDDLLLGSKYILHSEILAKEEESV